MQKLRIASIMLILVTILTCAVPTVSAIKMGTVQSDEITNVNKDDVVSIPIALQDSEELMGFKLTFTPSSDELEVTDVKSSELTKNGIFNHNADITEGAFDIIWTGTESIGKNGVICYLQAKCKEDFNEFSFEISYSQPDTFDESFNDFKLDCKTVKLKGQMKDTTKTEDTTEKSTVSADENITELISQPATEKSEYSEIAQSMINNNDKSHVVKVVDDFLKKYDYTSLDETEDENLDELISGVSSSSDTFESVTKEFDNDEKLEIIKEIYNSDDKQNSVSLYIVVAVTCVLALVAVIIALVFSRRNRV